MKIKYLHVSLFLLLSFTYISLQGQTKSILTIKNKLGGKVNFELNEISKITFPSGNIKIDGPSSNSGSYSINNIQLLKFGKTTPHLAVSGNTLNDLSISLYPNPVHNQLNIVFANAINENLVINVFSTSGTLALSEALFVDAESFELDIFNLPKGLYICQFKGNVTSKTLKFVKQ